LGRPAIFLSAAVLEPSLDYSGDKFRAESQNSMW